jgi:hypothetical protein
VAAVAWPPLSKLNASVALVRGASGKLRRERSNAQAAARSDELADAFEQS